MRIDRWNIPLRGEIQEEDEVTLPSPVTIVLADDHPMFRQGLRDTIVGNTSYAVIGEASNGEDALKLVQDSLPTIAILDIEMPKMNGLEMAMKINEENLPVRVIILTMYDEYALFNKAIDAGVKGYILKESAVHDILSGISKVAGGEYYFSPTLSSYFLKRSAETDYLAAQTSGLDSLTSMENKVLHLIAESKSSKEIAERLNVSVRTVESHRYNICHKLQLNGSYALLRFALTNQGRL